MVTIRYGARRRRAAIAVALATLVLAALGALGGGARAADSAVAMSGFAFSPRSVTVSVGDAVTWTNSDDAPHTATADDGSFHTGNVTNGDSAQVTFDSAGTFGYHCEIHPTMTGTITVQAAAGGGAGAGGGGATAPPSDTSPASGDGADAWTPGALITLGGLLAAVAVGFAVAFRRAG